MDNLLYFILILFVSYAILEVILFSRQCKKVIEGIIDLDSNEFKGTTISLTYAITLIFVFTTLVLKSI